MYYEVIYTEHGLSSSEGTFDTFDEAKAFIEEDVAEFDTYKEDYTINTTSVRRNFNGY